MAGPSLSTPCELAREEGGALVSVVNDFELPTMISCTIRDAIIIL